MTETALSRRALVALGAFGFVFPNLGCGSSPQAKAPEPLPPMFLEPLADVVAGAGLEWLATLEPKTIAASPEMTLALRELLPPQRFRDFQERHGVDLRSLDDLVIASYRSSFLALGRGFLDPARIERSFSARVVVDGRHTEAGGGIVHVSARRGEAQERLLILGTRAAGIERGNTGPLKAAELFALGKLRRSRPALATEPLATTQKKLGAWPARIFFPGPFENEWARAGGGLLRTATAVAMGARPTPDRPEVRIEVVVIVLGTFTDTDGATARLGAAIDRLLASDIGHLLGTDQPAEPLRVDVIDGGLRARIVLRAAPLFRGLHVATQARADEIFR